MDTSEFKELFNDLHKSPTMYHWARFFSLLTWEKIAFARRIGNFKLFETTLTQELLFNFYLFACERSLPVEIFEARDERANGNDLELFIETATGFISLSCQAKMADTRNRYANIDHRVKGVHQLDLLLNYARKQDGLPIYWLYNFVTLYTRMNDLDQYNALKPFGCSYVPAETIKEKYYLKREDNQNKPKWIIPSFNDLHPGFAFPFCELFRSIGREGAFYIPGFEETTIEGVKKYTREEITPKKSWKDMKPPRAISGIDLADLKVAETVGAPGQQQLFNPKFRILFLREFKRTGGLYRQY